MHNSKSNVLKSAENPRDVTTRVFQKKSYVLGGIGRTTERHDNTTQLLNDNEKFHS